MWERLSQPAAFSTCAPPPPRSPLHSFSPLSTLQLPSRNHSPISKHPRPPCTHLDTLSVRRPAPREEACPLVATCPWTPRHRRWPALPSTLHLSCSRAPLAVACPLVAAAHLSLSRLAPLRTRHSRGPSRDGLLSRMPATLTHIHAHTRPRTHHSDTGSSSVESRVPAEWSTADAPRCGLVHTAGRSARQRPIRGSTQAE